MKAMVAFLDHRRHRRPARGRSRASLVLLVAAVVLVVTIAFAGCGDAGESGVITSIDDALVRDGDAELEGFIVVDGDRAQLCSVLMESFPPQCGEPAIDVAQVESLHVELSSSQSVSWTDQPVEVVGAVTDGVLTIDR